VQAEPLIDIAPRLRRVEAGAARQRLKLRHGVFVGALGVQVLTGLKGVLPAVQLDALRAAAEQMHLDALLLGLVEGVVVEGIDVEIGAELAVGPHQQV